MFVFHFQTKFNYFRFSRSELDFLAKKKNIHKKTVRWTGTIFLHDWDQTSHKIEKNVQCYLYWSRAIQNGICIATEQPHHQSTYTTWIIWKVYFSSFWRFIWNFMWCNTPFTSSMVFDIFNSRYKRFGNDVNSDRQDI